MAHIDICCKYNKTHMHNRNLTLFRYYSTFISFTGIILMHINDATKLHMVLSKNDLTNFSTSNPSALHLILHKIRYIINILHT